MPDSPRRGLHVDATYAHSEQVLAAKTVTALSYCDSDAHLEMRFSLHGYKTTWRARMSSVRGTPGLARAMSDPVGMAVQAGVAFNAF